LVDWTKRNHPQSLLVRIDFPYNPFPDRQSNPRPCLSEVQLKVILRACYEEIDDAWMRFQTGQKILVSTGPVEGCHPSLCECVRGMAAVSGGVMPTMLELLDKKVGVATGQSKRRAEGRSVLSSLNAREACRILYRHCHPDSWQSGCDSTTEAELPSAPSAR
jgi:hypothetical protein